MLLGNVLTQGIALRDGAKVAAVVRRASGRIELRLCVAPAMSGWRAIPVLRAVAWATDPMFGDIYGKAWANACWARDLEGDDRPVDDHDSVPTAGDAAPTLVWSAASLLVAQLVAHLVTSVTAISTPIGSWRFEALTLLVYLVLFSAYALVIGRNPDVRGVYRLNAVMLESIWVHAERGEATVEQLRAAPNLHPASSGTGHLYVVLFAFTMLVTAMHPFSVASAVAAHALLLATKLALLPLAFGVTGELGVLLTRVCVAAPALRGVVLATLALSRCVVREPTTADLELGAAALRGLRAGDAAVPHPEE